MEESVDFKNKINVFYVTSDDPKHPMAFVSRIILNNNSGIKTKVPLYLSMINLDTKKEIFARIKYGFNDKTSPFVGPTKIEETGSEKGITSVTIHADFQLPRNEFVKFEVEIGFMSGDSFTTCDYKTCYVYIEKVD